MNMRSYFLRPGKLFSELIFSIFSNKEANHVYLSIFSSVNMDWTSKLIPPWRKRSLNIFNGKQFFSQFLKFYSFITICSTTCCLFDASQIWVKSLIIFVSRSTFSICEYDSMKPCCCSLTSSINFLRLSRSWFLEIIYKDLLSIFSSFWFSCWINLTKRFQISF